MKKEAREIAGRRYVLEPSIKGDVAFVRAWKVDEVGNCVFRSVTLKQGKSQLSSRSWISQIYVE